MTNQTRLRVKYPVAFKNCLPEALQYGKCVVQSIDLKVNECEKEFKDLNKCFKETLRKMNGARKI